MQNTLDSTALRVALVTELAAKFNLNEEQASNVAEFLEGEDDLDQAVFEKLLSWYMSSGEMPYGVAKARNGDPYEWIFNTLSREFDL